MGKIFEQMGEYLEYCEKVRGMSSVTMGCKRNILERFIRVTGLSDVRELTNEVFNEWVSYLSENGVAPRSINTYNAAVLAMARYYRGVGLAVPLQMALVGKLREGAVRRRFYTFDEVETAISYADFETGLMIRIMFETGMRIAELARLRVDDFEGRRVRFVAKGRKLREVYVRSDTLELVTEYVGRYGVTGYLWSVREGNLTLNGEPPTVNTVRGWLKRAFEAAGFEGFYPHALRHSFATDLQLRGASVAEIKEMIGHSSIATTERYLHGFEGKMRELFDKYR